MDNNIQEQHKNIPSSDARNIANHYRSLGGYKVELKEESFRADITVYITGNSPIQGNFRRVNR